MLDIARTVHKQEVIYSLFNSSNCNDLGCASRSFIDWLEAFSNGIFLRCKISILTNMSYSSSAKAQLLAKNYEMRGRA